MFESCYIFFCVLSGNKVAVIRFGAMVLRFLC